MRRRLVNAGAWTSLASLVLWAALWAHSGVGSLAVSWSIGGANEYHLRSDWGRVVLTRVHHPAGDELPRVISAEAASQGGYYGASWGLATRRATLHRIVDFAAGPIGAPAAMSPARFTRDQGAVAGASFWRLTTYHPVLLPLMLLPAIPWMLAARKRLAERRRRRSGRCAACGYDLRESPGRCPECGAGVAAQPV